MVQRGRRSHTGLNEDIATLCADAKDLDNGTSIKITIWEKDKAGEDDFIKIFTSSVNNGKIERKWTLGNCRKSDDSNKEQEQSEEDEESTPLKYLFKMETTGSPETMSSDSPELEFLKPEFTELQWIYIDEDENEEEKTEIDYGKNVILRAHVKNVNEDSRVKVRIYKTEYEQEDDYILQEYVNVVDGILEFEWIPKLKKEAIKQLTKDDSIPGDDMVTLHFDKMLPGLKYSLKINFVDSEENEIIYFKDYPFEDIVEIELCTQGKNFFYFTSEVF